jgi:hypothetical protein
MSTNDVSYARVKPFDFCLILRSGMQISAQRSETLTGVFLLLSAPAVKCLYNTSTQSIITSCHIAYSSKQRCQIINE